MKFLKKIIIIAYIAIIFIMALATVLEKINGYTDIYDSVWFCTIWGILAISAITYIFIKKLFVRPFVFALHIALALILLGALITHLTALRGTLHVRTDMPATHFTPEDNAAQLLPLPFRIELDSFAVQMYPGTMSAMDYVSIIKIVDNNYSETKQVSMNNIAEYKGYRFYQSAYDYDEKGTILAISHDTWGIAITYMGYAMLFLAMFLLLVLPNEGFRKALKNMSNKAIVLLLFILSTNINSSAELKTLSPKAASEFCNLYVYYNGRICPLQTVAKDFTLKLYGKSSYNGYSAEQVFSGWYFFPYNWKEEQMIKMKSGEKKYISFDELNARHNNSPIDNEKLSIIRMLINGQMTKIFPHTNNNKIVWYSQSDNLPQDMPTEQWNFIRKSPDYLAELAVNADEEKLITTIEKIRKYQIKNASNVLPSDVRFKAEKLYNNLNYTRVLAMALSTLGILSFLFFVVRWSKNKPITKWIIVASNVIITIVLLYLLTTITLRGYVSQHLPISNGYETMQFMALTTLVITLLAQRKFVLIIPFGLLLTGLTLMVSMFGESNPQITNLMPVLASPLLSLHVCVIMIAYSLLAFMMFNGITALIMEAQNKPSESAKLYRVSMVLIYPALFLLTAGIFIGAIWANQSWGRYWGWDPKEVWALITMLVYAIPLHPSIVTAIKRPKTFHIFAIVAFLTVLMTYFGVNFLLGGMHSYAAS